MAKIAAVSVPVKIWIGGQLSEELFTIRIVAGDSFPLILADALEATAEEIRRQVDEELVDPVLRTP